MTAIKKGPRVRDLEQNVSGLELNVSNWFFSSDGTNRTVTLLNPELTRGWISASFQTTDNTIKFFPDNNAVSASPSFCDGKLLFATGSAFTTNLSFQVLALQLTASADPYVQGGIFSGSIGASPGLAPSGSFSGGALNGTIQLELMWKTRSGR